jgi:sarcosine oxidase, subunit beta
VNFGPIAELPVDHLARPQYDVAIVGGGITGCATAYELARAGASVVVLERYEINTEASGRNAGSLHGQIQHQPFVEYGEMWARAFGPALVFLMDSLKLWSTLSEELGVDLEVKTHGGLLVVDNPAQMRLVERKVEIEREAGLASEVLSRADLAVRAPYLSSAIIGAGFSPVEGKANPMLAAPAFAHAAVRFGAEIRTRTMVQRVTPTTDGVELTTSRGVIRADRAVLVSGDALAAQTSELGLTLPISTEPVQVSATEPLEPLIEHLVYFAGQRLTLKQAKTGAVLIGGGWSSRLDPNTNYPLTNLDSLQSNIAVALHVAPALGQALIVRSWAGVGNGLPDLRPVIGALPSSSRVLLGLFPHMGFTAGPLMGRVLADLALGRSATMDLDPYRPDRFDNA